MRINHIIKCGIRAKKRDAARATRNKQLGIVRGSLPSFARKSKLSGMAQRLGTGYQPYPL